MAAFGLTVGAALAASGFVDVTDNHRASAEITAAHQVGVFQGYGDGTFRPDEKLTRGQSELVIDRMLTWQGTDDDGNFEISRADAAVLAMSGLCGLDPDRIPACAAVGAASEAEVQAAYDRGYDNGFDDGFDDGLDAATPTGSTPPPVTNPPAPAATVQKCEDRRGFFWTTEHEYRFDIHRSRFVFVPSGRYRLGWDNNLWHHRHVADFLYGFVCTEYQMAVNYDLQNPDLNTVTVEIISYCWETKIDPITGLRSENKYEYRSRDHKKAADATPAILVATARDRPGPDHWPAHDPADCLRSDRSSP